MKIPFLFFTVAVALVSTAWAELKLPAIIGDHMVLQQKQSNSLWGWDSPGTRVTVTFAGQKHTAVAGSDGKWTVKLEPLLASAQGREILFKGTSERKIVDVLVGEVWVCAGQSNMAWRLDRTNTGDIEGSATNLPHLRLISVPAKGTQELQTDFQGKWEAANPTSVKTFSAVGFFFGRYLQQTLGVPVGLINNAWGGTSAEAWIRRDSLERNPRFKPLMEATAKREAEEPTEAGRARFAALMAKWKEESQKARAEGRTSPSTPLPWMTGKVRPSNAFAGILHPTLGYGIKGVIWYQGESNAARAHEYADLFPFLITEWRREWGQRSHVVYSDDRGASWKVGGIAVPGTNECQAVELSDGRVMLNMRNFHRLSQRAVSTSDDGGLTWSPLRHDPGLIEPTCQASIIAWKNGSGKNLLLFSNPASVKRENMTVRLSEDEGTSWSHSNVLHAGPSAYSCLVALGDSKFACLYERSTAPGAKESYDLLTFAAFDLEWVKSGKRK